MPAYPSFFMNKKRLYRERLTKNSQCFREDYISKIIELINNNIIGEAVSARAISLLMGMNHNYLSDKLIKEGKYEQYNKYFTLATNFLLLNSSDLKFRSDIHCKKFMDGSLEIIFQEMVRKGIFSKDESLAVQETQFRALVYTLYAINKAMKNRCFQNRHDELKLGKTKDFLYSWNNLS